MKNAIYILAKYWKKHPKSAFAVMLSGTVMTAILTLCFMYYRASFNVTLHDNFDELGVYDLILPDFSEEEISALLDGRNASRRSEIYVLGKVGNALTKFTYGCIDDSAGLMHIPLESGRMPESACEAAADRAALNALNFAGGVGDSIMLDGEKYTLAGIINEKYGKRQGSEISVYSENREVEDPIPLIYIGKREANVKYKITLLDGVIENAADMDYYTERLAEKNGGQGVWYIPNNKENLADFLAENIGAFGSDMRFVLILSVIAAMIGVLSVFSVLRSVFIERETHIKLLRRVGSSRKNIIKMYALEAAGFFAAQTLLGIPIGLLGNYFITLYRREILGEARYDAFTADPLVTSRTPEPLFLSVIFSAVIIISAYLLTGISGRKSLRTKQKISKNHNCTVGYLTRKIFSQKSVSVIQAISLTLIFFGAVMGYMYFTNDGKSVPSYLPVSFRIANEIDMREENISEYYFCSPENFSRNEPDDGTGVVTVATKSSDGLSDGDLSAFDNIIAAGEICEAYAVFDEKRPEFGEEISFHYQEEIDFYGLMNAEKYKNFFGENTRNFYNIPIKLADLNSISRLSEYVISGEINAEKIMSGEEIIAVYPNKSAKINASEELEISAFLSEDCIGISKITNAKTRIGAVVTLPKSADKLLSYAVKSENLMPFNKFWFLTTASGGKALGLENSAYRQLFAPDGIDGGLLPLDAGMKRMSLAELEKSDLEQKVFRFGGIALIALVMAVLGFAAYFSGIGIKVKIKSYNIAVLRALGATGAFVRLRFIRGNLTLPLISAGIASALIKLVQLAVYLSRIVCEKIGDKLTDMFWEIMASGHHPDADSAYNYYENLKKDIAEFFFHNACLDEVQIWKPMLVITLVICAVTTIITVISLKKTDVKPSDLLSRERTRS